jgi:hypothetical protein
MGIDRAAVDSSSRLRGVDPSQTKNLLQSGGKTLLSLSNLYLHSMK